ncbi:MAG: hypothetical protein R8J85_06755 [Mariprofundales bacterium]
MNHYCQQASQLASERLDRKLGLGERLHLWLHLAMCRLCRDNVHATKRVHQLVRGQQAAFDSAHLDAQQLEKIAKAMRSEV